MKQILYTDADGVLCDFYPFLDFINEILGTALTPEEYVDYDLTGLLGISRKRVDDLVREFFLLNPDLPEMPGAVRALKKLGEKYVVRVITARPKEAELATIAWLTRKGILSTVFFTGIKKAKVLKGNPSAILVEDNPDTADIVAKNGNVVYLIDYPYNRCVSHPNIRRVNGWDEILDDLLPAAS